MSVDIEVIVDKAARKFDVEMTRQLREALGDTEGNMIVGVFESLDDPDMQDQRESILEDVEDVKRAVRTVVETTLDEVGIGY